jgi:hypothetical protein
MWYVFGDAVIDRILGTSRAAEISVYSDVLPLSPGEVRRALGIPLTPPVFITNDPPVPVTNLDCYVLYPNGDIREPGSDTIEPPQLPLRLRIQSSQLAPSDVMRLDRVIRSYPEVMVDESEVKKVRERMEDLMSRLHESPEFAACLYHDDLENKWEGRVHGD